jgi:DNA adenine methylase
MYLRGEVMSVPHPFQYQGSKRKIAPQILKYFPDNVKTLYEPFAGSAAITIAAAYYRKAERFFINDTNKALMDLFDAIINNPENLIDGYTKLWYEQLGQEKEYYQKIRDEFNKDNDPVKFFYLLNRCVKGAVRYNSQGEFNQSPDNRRKGAKPSTVRKNILGVSQLLRGKTQITSTDYKEILFRVEPQDIVYMDPPYQGVCTGHDTRYYESICHEEFIESLAKANELNISYIVSYDGKTGEKEYGKELPEYLNLTHIHINAGTSTQAVLLGRYEKTIESLYLSPALMKRLGNILDDNIKEPEQLCLKVV